MKSLPLALALSSLALRPSCSGASEFVASSGSCATTRAHLRRSESEAGREALPGPGVGDLSSRAMGPSLGRRAGRLGLWRNDLGQRGSFV